MGLTVKDMEASAEWYKGLFGWIELGRLGPDEAGTPRILLFDQSTGFVVTLCQPEDGAGDAFDHRRTGLDHLAFLVASRAEMDAWVAHLTERGVAHSPIREVPPLGSLVAFDDPNGIQLELWLNAGS